MNNRGVRGASWFRDVNRTGTCRNHSNALKAHDTVVRLLEEADPGCRATYTLATGNRHQERLGLRPVARKVGPECAPDNHLRQSRFVGLRESIGSEL